MSDFSYPYKDAAFVIDELIGFDRLCEEARSYRFAAVCVNPVWVRRSAQSAGGEAPAGAGLQRAASGGATLLPEHRIC